MQTLRMEMDDVEGISEPCDALHHDKMRHQRIGASQSERTGPCRFEPRARRRIAAREQRHLMAKLDQLLGEIGNDPLGAAIQLRWAGFMEWRDLRYSHLSFHA